jgi:hypothetical protein
MQFRVEFCTAFPITMLSCDLPCSPWIAIFRGADVHIPPMSFMYQTLFLFYCTYVNSVKRLKYVAWIILHTTGEVYLRTAPKPIHLPSSWSHLPLWESQWRRWSGKRNPSCTAMWIYVSIVAFAIYTAKCSETKHKGNIWTHKGSGRLMVLFG